MNPTIATLPEPTIEKVEGPNSGRPLTSEWIHSGPTSPDLQMIQSSISGLVLRSSFDLLSQGIAYANKLNRPKWDFATEISELRQIGLTLNDLRLLLINDVLEHAREVPSPKQPRRVFATQDRLRFSHRTCFVLTEKGIQFADQFGKTCVDQEPNAKPTWDSNRLELRYDEHIVKRYRVPSRNQVAVLNAFHEDGWPVRIDDPIPPDSERCSKRRLLDTIKNLNRNHKYRCIRFHGDGTGEGVLWSWLQST